MAILKLIFSNIKLVISISSILFIFQFNLSLAAPLPVNLQLNSRHSSKFAGYYAALKKGYYDQEGITLSIIQAREGRSPVAEVLNGKAAFGIAGSNILPVRASGKPVVIVAAIFQHTQVAFMSLESSHICTMSDLQGKRIMIPSADDSLLLKAVLLREGVTAQKIGVMGGSGNNIELIRNQADAIMSFDINKLDQIFPGLFPVNIIVPEKQDIDFYGDLLFTSEEMAETNSALVEAFKRASLRGWQYALKHKAEIAKYILELPGVRSDSVGLGKLINEANENENNILPHIIEIGYVNPSRLQNILNILSRLNLTAKNLSLNGLIYDSSYREKKRYKLFLYVIIVILLADIVFIILNKQLRKRIKVSEEELVKEIEQRFDTAQNIEMAADAVGLTFWEYNVSSAEFKYSGNSPIFGYKQNKFPKDIRQWHKIIHNKDIAKVKEIGRKALSRISESDSATYRLKDANGEWKWILSICKTATADELGKPLKITGIHVDISGLKSREDELNELTKEMFRKNSNLEEFAFIASHNFRAPVANLKSLVKLYTDDELDHETRQNIFGYISDSVDKLDETIMDLAEIVSSKSDNQVIKENLNLEEELQGVLTHMGSQVKGPDFKITSDFTKMASVYFSGNYLRSIFKNLITNSIKYKLPAKDVEISVSSAREDGFTIVFFSDNGRGIDMEKYEGKLFGLYQRFHTDPEGKGLGLYIIKSEMESLGGKVLIESKPGDGTTVKLYFREKILS